MEADPRSSNQLAPKIANVIFSRLIRREATVEQVTVAAIPEVSDTWETDGGRPLRTNDELAYDWCFRIARRIDALITG